MIRLKNKTHKNNNIKEQKTIQTNHNRRITTPSTKNQINI
ncbi:hypothetical protein PAUR_b0177 [Pseudoalteromonas aurantia 208]|uniref:Uncharacterized protein n=1 Tax=Pseudoalteromonas aurantia 208 TaxID=1314867 RepID=A0ABR9EGW2_9GAMM|nr:hypothetical protein [Pseudoalteromonas aurantia 208]